MGGRTLAAHEYPLQRLLVNDVLQRWVRGGGSHCLCVAGQYRFYGVFRLAFCLRSIVGQSEEAAVKGRHTRWCFSPQILVIHDWHPHHPLAISHLFVLQ